MASEPSQQSEQTQVTPSPDRRQSGMTTLQMREAPQGAVYVWPNEVLGYPKRLARDIGRDDLQIVSPWWLRAAMWQGMRLSGIVLDHATELTSSLWDSYFRAKAQTRT